MDFEFGFILFLTLVLVLGGQYLWLDVHLKKRLSHLGHRWWIIVGIAIPLTILGALVRFIGPPGWRYDFRLMLVQIVILAISVYTFVRCKIL